MTQEQTDSPEISPELIQKLFDAGLVDKSVLDQVAVKTQSDQAADDLSEQAAPVIDEAAKKTGMSHKEIVDRVFPYLMNAEDASGDPNAVSPKGATGVSQVMPETGAEEAKKLGMTEYDLKNPDDNKKIGSNYYDDQVARYKGDPELALAAYNAGPGTVDKALKKSGGSSYEDIKNYLPSETRAYVKKIDGNLKKKEGVTLASLRDTAASQAQPQAETSKPGIFDKIKSGLAAEFSGEAEAEEPQKTAAPDQTVAATPTAAPPPMGTQTPVVDGTTPAPDAIQPPAAATEPTITPTPTQAITPDQTAQPAASAAPIQSAGVPAQAQPQVDPNENVALANAANTAQAGDPAATIDNLASGQAAPNTDQQMKNAFALEQMGKTQEGEAIAQGAQNEAAAYAEKAKAIAEVGTDFTQKRAIAEAATQKDLDRFRQKVIDFGSATIDPNKVFKDMSTVGKILFGISLAAVALGGKPGQASALIYKAIDQDVAIQKANFELKKQDISNEATLMSANHSQLNSIDAAETQTRAQMIAKAVAMVDQAAATAKSEQAKANLITLSGQLKQQQLTLEEKFQQDRLKTHSMNQLAAASTQGMAKDEQAYANQAQQDLKFAAQMVSLDGKPVGIAKSPKASTLLDTANTTRTVISDNLKTLREIVKSSSFGDTVMNPTTAADATRAVAAIHEQLARSLSTGSRMAATLKQSFEKQLPLNMFESDMGLGMAGRIAKKTGQMLGVYDRVGNAIDELQKQVDNQYVAESNSLLIPGTKTEAFRKQLLGIQGLHGGDPDIKENK